MSNERPEPIDVSARLAEAARNRTLIPQELKDQWDALPADQPINLVLSKSLVDSLYLAFEESLLASLAGARLAMAVKDADDRAMQEATMELALKSFAAESGYNTVLITAIKAALEQTGEGMSHGE